MNSGNLINSLLGPTNSASANRTTAEKAAVKERADLANDLADRFRDALKQVRPNAITIEPMQPKPVPAKPPQNGVLVEKRAGDGTTPDRAPTNVRLAEPANQPKSRPAVAEARSNDTVQANTLSDREGASSRGSVSGGERAAQSISSEDNKPSMEAREEDDTDKKLAETQADTAAATAMQPDQTSPIAEVTTGLTGSAETLLLQAIDAESLDVTGVVAGHAPLDNLSAAEMIGAHLMATLPQSGEPQAESSTGAIAVGSANSTSVLQALNAASYSQMAMLATSDLGFVANSENMALMDDAAPGTIKSGPDVGLLSLEGNPDFTLLSGKATLGKLMDEKVVGEFSLEQTEAIKGFAKSASSPVGLNESLVRLGEVPSPAARSFVVQTGVPVTVGQPQWSQAVGEKVLWLAAQNVSAAEIRLDPPDLGQLNVRISINQDQATVSFSSPHPMVREALDQQLSRLRDMFAEQGLNLVNVDVSDRSPRHGQGSESGEQAPSHGDTDADELTPIAESVVASARLVDHYA